MPPLAPATEPRRDPTHPSELVDVLAASLEALAAAGRVEEACRLAGRACAALRRSEPAAWQRFNALLHRLTRRLP